MPFFGASLYPVYLGEDEAKPVSKFRETNDHYASATKHTLT